MKKILIFALALTILMSVSLAQEISVVLNGEPLKTDVAPMEIQGRVMVPVRVISEKLGATVDFNFETNEITITKSNNVIKLTLESKNAYINGMLKVLDVPAKEINNRTLVPIRFVGESLGADVAWDDTTETVRITSNSNIDLDRVTNNIPAIEKEEYTVKFIVDKEKAEVTGEGKYTVGEEVKITITSKKGYEYLRLKSRSGLTDGSFEVSSVENVTIWKFNMPKNDVEVDILFTRSECSEGYKHKRVTGYIDGKNGVYHKESLYCSQCNEVFKVISVLEHNFINGKCICGANVTDKYFWSQKFAANYDASILELIKTQPETFSNCMALKGKINDINVVILAEFSEDKLMWLAIEPCWDELERTEENYYGQDYAFDILAKFVFTGDEPYYWDAPDPRNPTEPGYAGDVLGVVVEIKEDSNTNKLTKLEIKNEFLKKGFEIIREFN